MTQPYDNEFGPVYLCGLNECVIRVQRAVRFEAELKAFSGQALADGFELCGQGLSIVHVCRLRDVHDDE